MSFIIKQNDRSPSIFSTIAADGWDGNIAGTDVRFILRKPGAASAKVNATATIVGAGSVRYDWAAGDTDTPGTYAAEWQVTFVGGLTRTFPSEGYLYVTIVPELG